MYKFYADNSALKKTKKGFRNVYLFGGILISREDEISLSNVIKRIKSEYTGESMPLKYNVKDLKNAYQSFIVHLAIS